MSIHQHATLEDTVYFWFGSNDTSGSGDDGASPACDVRLAGATISDVPILSPTPALISHVNYPAGAYEVAVDATAGNGFSAANTYAVFCTLTVDSQDPTGFVGSFTLDPIIANVKEVSDDATAADNAELFFDGTGYAGTNNVIPTVTTLTNHTAQTGDSYAIVNSGTYGNSAIETLIDDLESRLTAARAGYLDNLNIGENVAGTSEISGLNDPTAATVSDAVWDETSTGHVGAGKAGQQLWTDVDAILTDTGELQTDDIPTSIAALPTAVENRQEMDSNSTQLSAIVTDTNELQTDDVPGLIAALNDPTAVAIRTEMDNNSTQLSAIVTDTNELQTDDVPGLIAALNDITVADILTTAITEAYAADGAAPTLAQALCLIQQSVGDFSISGTTLTVNKLDGSTTAATYTLDSASNPTSRTRAT